MLSEGKREEKRKEKGKKKVGLGEMQETIAQLDLEVVGFIQLKKNNHIVA